MSKWQRQCGHVFWLVKTCPECARVHALKGSRRNTRPPLRQCKCGRSWRRTWAKQWECRECEPLPPMQPGWTREMRRQQKIDELEGRGT